MKAAKPPSKSQGDQETARTQPQERTRERERLKPRPAFSVAKGSPSSSPTPFSASTKLSDSSMKPPSATAPVASGRRSVAKQTSSSDTTSMTGRQLDLLASLKAVRSRSAVPRNRSASAITNAAPGKPVTPTKPPSKTASNTMLRDKDNGNPPRAMDGRFKSAVSTSSENSAIDQPPVGTTENQQVRPSSPRHESTATHLKREQADPQTVPGSASADQSQDADQSQEKNDTNSAAGDDDAASRASSVSSVSPSDLRASSLSSVSLPDLHALLASTQTGRKPRSPSPITTNAEPARGKKRRLSTNASVPPPAKRPMGPRRRHHDFWALDGSIVLQFEEIMFRLHRSDLVRRSKYFADLLVPGENEETETVDGCPVYQVPGKAKDFERLWRAVDDAISYVHTPPAFSVLASILQAATTYEFPAFRTWAVKTFEAMWPHDLASLSATRRLHATQSILLARACDVPTVLRHAFYELSRHPSFGIEEEDTGTDDEDADHAALSRADLTRLIQLRPRLQSAWLDIVQMPPASCGKNGCAAASTWASGLVADPIFEEGLLCDPLEALQRLLHRDLQGLCKGCVEQAKAGWVRTREKIWEQKLDLWLGLE